jgi:hypothetical protein
MPRRVSALRRRRFVSFLPCSHRVPPPHIRAWRPSRRGTEQGGACIAAQATTRCRVHSWAVSSAPTWLSAAWRKRLPLDKYETFCGSGEPLR